MTVEEYVSKTEDGQIEGHNISIFSKYITPLWNRSGMRADSDLLLTILGDKNSVELNDIERLIVSYGFEYGTLGYVPQYIRLFKKITDDGICVVYWAETNDVLEEQSFIRSFDEYENKDLNSFGLKPLD